MLIEMKKKRCLNLISASRDISLEMRFDISAYQRETFNELHLL